MSNAWWQPQTRKGVRIGPVKVSISFEPRDLWIGLFWDHRHGVTQLFITIIPCFPLRLAWGKEKLV